MEEYPEISAALDSIMEFMEEFPETWIDEGFKKNDEKIVKKSEWVFDYLSSFIWVPFFLEPSEIQIWLIKSKLLIAGENLSTNKINMDIIQNYSRSNIEKDIKEIKEIELSHLKKKIMKVTKDKQEVYLEEIKFEEEYFLKRWYE